MQDPASPVLTVTDEKVAAVLLDAAARRWLEPFFRPCSISQAAKQLDEAPNSVLYRVKRWGELGLLVVDHETVWRGRTVKHYRTVAEAFFVPFAVTPYADLLALLQTTNAPYLETLYHHLIATAATRSLTWGVQFRFDKRLTMQAAPAPNQLPDIAGDDFPAVIEQFTHLQLEPAEAKALQRSLLSLLAQYQAKQGGQAYLCYVGLTPLE